MKKLWSNYKKEMKIASRGFYFYMEIFIALILLGMLMLAVPTERTTTAKEILFPDMSEEAFEELISMEVDAGYNERLEDVEFKLKPITLTYTDMETGEEVTHVYEDTKTVIAKQYVSYDSVTGKAVKTIYVVDNFDDMMRIAYDTKYTASQSWFGEDGLDYYCTVLFGYETDRYMNLLEVSYGTVDTETLLSQMEIEEGNTTYLESEETLNNRQNLLPLVLVLMNGITGMMIIIAYISVDKSEGLIKAMCVSPMRIGGYLLSKILVVLTTVFISTLMIIIPVMGMQPHYLLLTILTISTTALCCIFGALISTFYDDLKSAFGIIVMVAIVMMLPMITYMLPGFNPTWMKVIPSYYMLQALKETLLVSCDVTFVITSSFAMLIASGVLFLVVDRRFKKILGI